MKEVINTIQEIELNLKKINMNAPIKYLTGFKFYPTLIGLTSSIEAAILLSYLHERCQFAKLPFTQHINLTAHETGLNLRKLRDATAVLVGLDFIEVTKDGKTNVATYGINVEAILEALKQN